MVSRVGLCAVGRSVQWCDEMGPVDERVVHPNGDSGLGQNGNSPEAGNAAVGLSTEEARGRLAEFGRNELPTGGRSSWWDILLRQFQSVLLAILVAAAVIAIVLGEVVDAAAIAAIIFLNGLLGFVQEWKAERSLDALAAMLRPRADVIRDGHRQTIDASEIVPGDLVILEMGCTVPADLGLVEATNLAADESVLTGESESVSKSVDKGGDNQSRAERRSSVWMGTTIVRGHGKGVVEATGLNTEFGRVAELTADVETLETPLTRQLNHLARQIGIVAISLAALVIAVGLVTGRPAAETFFLGISLAVALVPEGLPAAVTITLAMGIRAMARRRALLRRLQAAESLGAATVICTDKTGTLTENRMVVSKVVTTNLSVTVTGSGYEPVGEFQTSDGSEVCIADHAETRNLMFVAGTCNRAELWKDDEQWHVRGEPTEAALVTLARKAGVDSVRVGYEIPFSSDRKRMSVVTDERSPMVLVKGAPDVLIAHSQSVQSGETAIDLDDSLRSEWLRRIDTLAEQGMRTLGFAFRVLASDEVERFSAGQLGDNELESSLTFLGIVGILDPPRPEVAGAMAEAHKAGLRVVMVTGDAARTARAIADHVGFPGVSAVTGAELAKMPDEEMHHHVMNGAVLARTRPADKLRLVRLLQDSGEVVAMTGDGVNDAPALKRADIGVAMGIRGTDVARAAADIVLTDDNFRSIVDAVAEGRRQFENIRKFVLYLLSSNAGELVAIVGCVLMGWPLILLPVQILWMNLVTDGLSAMALGAEKAEPDSMQRPPHKPDEPILNRWGFLMIAAGGCYLGGATLYLFDHVLKSTGDLVLAQTAAFTGIVMIEKANVFNFRSLRWPLWVKGYASNPWLLLAIAGTITIQVLAVSLPALQSLLSTKTIPVELWGKILALCVPVIVIPELLKALLAKRNGT